MLDSPDFLRRVLRWLAIICLAAGLISVLNLGTWLAFYPRNVYRYGGMTGRAGFAVNLAYLALPILGVVGGWALLRWKPWARRVLIAWALADIALGFISNILWYVDYATSMSRAAATTRMTSPVPSVAFQGWSMLVTCLARMPFPLIVLIVMLQPEVKELWARRAGGAFEVLPIVRPADAE